MGALLGLADFGMDLVDKWKVVNFVSVMHLQTEGVRGERAVGALLGLIDSGMEL